MHYRLLLVAFAIQLLISFSAFAQDLRDPITLRNAMEATLRLHPQLNCG